MVPSGRSRSLRIEDARRRRRPPPRPAGTARPAPPPGPRPSPLGREADGQRPAREVGQVQARGCAPGPRWRGSGGCSLTSRACCGLSARMFAGDAQEGHQRHHQLLADRVDRRVGDLREELLEVPVEQLRLLGEHRQRLVGAHRADRLVAGGGHGVEDELEVLARVAEAASGAAAGVPGRASTGRDGAEEAVDRDLVLLHPAAVGLAAREPHLDLARPSAPAARARSTRIICPGRSAPFSRTCVRRDVEHAGLGGEDHEAVLGDGVARGPQPVAVEQRADACGRR